MSATMGLAPQSPSTKVPAPRRRLDQPLALQLGQRPAHGDARYAMLGGERLLARQRAVVAEAAAGDPVAQQQINLPRLGGLDAGHPACLPRWNL